MAGKSKTKKRAKSSLLTRVLLLVLLIGIGWKLHDLRAQVASAQNDMELLAARVDAQRQENDALSADIAEGNTPEKMEELAREVLGLVTPDEYVFYDVSN